MAKILALAFLHTELSGGAVSVLPATPPILGSRCHGALSTPFSLAPPACSRPSMGGAVASKLPLRPTGCLLPSSSRRSQTLGLPPAQERELRGPIQSLRVPCHVRPGWVLWVSSALIWRKRGPV